MKAFLVKKLSATSSRPIRLKVSCGEFSVKTYSADGFDTNKVECIEIQAIQRFVKDHGLTWEHELAGGVIPNGDFVATMHAKLGSSGNTQGNL